MLRLENVSKIYPPDSVALKNVTLHIQPGELVSIVGQSGAGKTTLMRLLMAEEQPSQGRITIGGWEITNIRPDEIPYLRRQMGVIFQDFKLLQKKTVFENIAFALEVCGAPTARIQEIVPQVLHIVGLEKQSDRFPRSLSGGEQQRVAIARSLVHRPKLILADEPTGNLDTMNTRDIMELLQKINALGTTVVLVTHNREVVNGLRKRVVTLKDGELVSDHEHGKYILPV